MQVEHIGAVDVQHLANSLGRLLGIAAKIDDLAFEIVGYGGGVDGAGFLECLGVFGAKRFHVGFVLGLDSRQVWSFADSAVDALPDTGIGCGVARGDCVADDCLPFTGRRSKGASLPLKVRPEIHRHATIAKSLEARRHVQSRI
ncbi:hypothetical protein NKH61_10575 [Mesorhizobium sp. M1005]|uniref:hypothetical protein n=1 Tax=unclassified Mesorhizobium TaxID=325217 RepID=UPI00333B7A92